MERNNQGRYAFLLVFISLIFVVGSLIAVFAETSINSGQQPAASSTPQITNIVFNTPTVVTATLLPTATSTNPPPPTETAIPAPSDTPTPQLLSQCTPPNGWVVYFILEGESLEDIAHQFNTTTDTLVEGNCLTSSQVQAGYLIFVPVVEPSATSAPSGACTKPAGWINYTVKSGDTLFKISRLFQTTVSELQTGNCLGSSTQIITGTRLWVPNNATITPTKSQSSREPKPGGSTAPTRAEYPKQHAGGSPGPFFATPMVLNATCSFTSPEVVVVFQLG